MPFSTAVTYSFSRRSNTHQFVFNQQGWDGGLGLYDYNARYYDPHIGKFISADTLVPDPAAPQAFNRYAYVLGNPLRYSDPTGHLTVEEMQNYFDYSDKDAMVGDGWDEELVDLLFSDGFTWSDVFSFTYQGQQVEAMLILMAANGDNTSFRGAFWGMSGPLEGVGLYGKEIQGGVNRHTDAAESLERQFRYGISYHNIPISDAWSFMV
ncbi:MAG TPA: RHS repeat-associated core domain-containing protein, partial [Bacteroidales bacterium]|nr:RHS repeat-associated core domain-containing protein [Bacteroidales bacterium]